jgi:hypothetical protein
MDHDGRHITLNKRSANFTTNRHDMDFSTYQNKGDHNIIDILSASGDFGTGLHKMRRIIRL